MGSGFRAALSLRGGAAGAVSAFLINRMIITDRLPIVNTAEPGGASQTRFGGAGEGSCGTEAGAAGEAHEKESPPAEGSAEGFGSCPIQQSEDRFISR